MTVHKYQPRIPNSYTPCGICGTMPDSVNHIAPTGHDWEPTEPPNREEWKPLELLIGNKAKHFMFMSKHQDIHLYKHIDTRRYLNIDVHGYTWAYNGHSYQQITAESAIALAFS